MNNELQVNFRDGVITKGIVCAHCGFEKADTVRPNYTYVSCDCPGHLDALVRGFDEMPNLHKRLDNFETLLENDPCINDGHCVFLSNSRRMCAACRLRLYFFHTIYNAEAYDSTLGE